MAEPVVGTSVTARQLKDLFRQIDDGSITGGIMQALLEHRDPFEKVSRITFEVIGTGFTALQWGTRLTSNGHKLTDWARDVLFKPDYDAKHRLELGKVYKVVLVRGKEIRKDSDRKTANLKAHATREIGEQAIIGLKAELALLIREKFTNAELEAMDLYYIAVLHEPIVDSDGHPSVLYSGRDDDRSLVYAGYGNPDDRWYGSGAFAFFAS